MINSASEFLALAALQRGTVSVEGQELHIRQLNVRECHRLAELAASDSAETLLHIVRAGITDADGKPLFGAEDDLTNVSPAFLNEAAYAILKLSGLANTKA